MGLASKRLAPRANLALLLAAPLFLDLLWPIFLVAGVEQVALDPTAPTPFLMLVLPHMPWSHSLVMAVVWSAALAGLAVALGGRRREALVVGAGVFSHWILDWVTHRPDMPIAPGLETRVGLGLWGSSAATIAVESTMFVASVVLYLGATRARGLAGHISIWSLVGFLGAVYAATIFGPPPPSAEAIRYAALATWVVVPWGLWIERTRQAVI